MTGPPGPFGTNRDTPGRRRLGTLVLFSRPFEFGNDCGTDIEEAMAVAADAMDGLDELLDSPAPGVVTDRFGDPAVVWRPRFWIGDPGARSYWATRTAVVGAVHGAFADAGIETPFPQRSLSARSGDPVKRRAAGENPEGDG